MEIHYRIIMKIIGIITEYNPFHNGHAYQIEKVKKELQADFVVIAMSGDFVQRGAPAILDKYARAKMTLSCGADLVVELPVLWATASAEAFAMAGVTLFDKIGCVDGICFGAETDNLYALSKIAEVLIREPNEYRTALSAYLKAGYSFPSARSSALCDYFMQSDITTEYRHEPNDTCDKEHILSAEEISSILNEPNNILAIEYLKALKRRQSSIVPYLIKREGAGYHDAEITSASAVTANLTSDRLFSVADTPPIPTASATAIRRELDITGAPFVFSPSDALVSSMPASALEILKEYVTEKTLLYPNDFSSILGYRLLTANTDTIAQAGDSNAFLANRIWKNRMNFSSFEQFCEQNKSKDMTYTRISRVLLHLILNITNEDYSFGKELDYIPYIRILGFRKDASVLLKELKKCSGIPVISKLAGAASLLDTDALALLEKDIFSADLYTQICAYKSNRMAQSEYTREMILK